MAGGFFSKIFGGGSAASKDPLAPVLSVLDDWKPGLMQETLTYIRENDGRPVLARLARLRQFPKYSKETESEWRKHHNLQNKQSMALLSFGGQHGALARYAEVLTAMRNTSTYRGGRDVADNTPEVAVNLLSLLMLGQRGGIKAENLIGKPTTYADVQAAFKALGGTDIDLISLVVSAGYQSFDAQIDGARMSDHIKALPVSDFIASLERRQTKDKIAVLKKLDGFPVQTDPAFLDGLQDYVASSSSQLRAIGVSLLGKHDPKMVEERMIPMLSKGSAAARRSAVQVLGAIASDSALEAMKARLSAEKSQDVIASINHYMDDGAAAAQDTPEGTYLGHDGSAVEIPQCAPLVDAGEAVLDNADLAALKEIDQKRFERAKREYPDRLERFKSGKSYSKTAPEKPKLRTNATDIYAILNGPMTDALFDEGKGERRQRGKLNTYGQDIEGWYKTTAPKLPDRRLIEVQLLQNREVGSALRGWRSNVGRELLRRIKEGQIDIRQILHIARERGVPLATQYNRPDKFYDATEEDYIKTALRLEGRFGSVPHFSQAWPISIAHLDVLLGAMPPRTTDININTMALYILAALPVLPAAAVDAVLFAALDPRRNVSQPAQAMLMDVDGIDDRLIATLADKRQAVRGNAATFLADRGVKAAVAPLVKKLKTEKSETARADMIAALDALEGDTAPYLGKAALMKEAQVFVSKLPNAKIDWLNLETAPALKWADGSAVDPIVPDAWLRLAVKLKSPEGSPLFGLYLDQLEPASVTALGNWVLASWIAHDTWKPASDELRGRAQKQAEADKAAGKTWYSSWTVDEIADFLLRNWQSGYANSGSDAKGILALTLRADPVTSSNSIAAYLKQHGKRVSQAKCLVEVLAGAGSPEALQVLVATSTRFKQRTVRELAGRCVSEIAEARGWTEHELADRSVPSGGFEEDGLLALEVGEEGKPYSARLGSDLSVKLFNPDGKEVKSIPAGKDDNTKESKKLLSDAKKAVKAVTAQQTTRLYDAMIGARIWQKSDWEADIVSHPILSRLVERVVWRGLDTEGKLVITFRPTSEGDRLTEYGDDADLSNVTQIDIAHTATVAEDIRQAWLTHLSDFEINPLFAQLSRPMQILDAAQGKLTGIKDREGWLMEAFQLRSAATKAGYDRGPVEDGASFYQYVKTFRNAGVRAELTFTGSYVPEDNIAVAVIEMQFRDSNENTYSEAKTLSEVPAMVLSEAWNDLHEIASVGAFDAEWQKKGLYS